MTKQQEEDMKTYMDDLTIAEAEKYRSIGMSVAAGNGHIYCIVPDNHRKTAEQMRVEYDAAEQKKED